MAFLNQKSGSPTVGARKCTPPSKCSSAPLLEGLQSGGKRVAGCRAAHSVSAKISQRPSARGLIEFAPGTRISKTFLFRTLNETNARTGIYGRSALSLIRRTLQAVSKMYKGEYRESEAWGGKKPALVHFLTIAIRAARFGYDAQSICAALLHDAVEDGKATMDELFALLSAPCKGFTKQELASFATDTLDMVSLLTKPKRSEDGRWVFPDEPEYFRMEDTYVSALHYDIRSKVYYDRLLSSSDMRAIFNKILDFVNNAETMEGMTEEHIKRNLRNMITHPMAVAMAMLPPADRAYVSSIFSRWGFNLHGLETKRVFPADGLVFLPRRDAFETSTWSRHPDASQGPFLSVYGDEATALCDGFIEVGFPPDTPMDIISVVHDSLADGNYPKGKWQITSQPSRVPETISIYEEIIRISGFTTSLYLCPSQRPGHVSVLNDSGKVLFELPMGIFRKRSMHIGEGLSETFEVARKEFTFITDALRAIFEDLAKANGASAPK